MNRSTFILGFALLVIAATLAASITMRNAPIDTRRAARPGVGTPQTFQARPLVARAGATGLTADAKTRSPRSQAHHQADATQVDSLYVALPEPWLTDLPAKQQAEWRARTATVERAARKKQDRLTTDLDLNAAQIDRMFPLIVRSTPGYDPVMLVGGSLTARTTVAAQTPLTANTPAAANTAVTANTAIAANTAVTAAEEIHQVLDPQQQALIEDQEVNRQLWWQDTLSRLEADLIDSTGGVAATQVESPTETLTDTPAVTLTVTPATPADTTPVIEERVAPDARENDSLFDLFDP